MNMNQNGVPKGARFEAVTIEEATTMMDDGSVDFDGFPPIVDAVWKNSEWVVVIRFLEQDEVGQIAHMIVQRARKKHKTITHYEMLSLKTQIFGEEHEALEVLHAGRKSRSGIRHLWVLPEGKCVEFAQRITTTEEGDE